MNFTREPIIETIISPKEGYKLLVRSSKGGSGAEEFFVDAVEVVSFGRGYFFRSLERPKAFLVPVSDYEILEVKETRVALKNVSYERNIKIGGGREASMRHSHQREQAVEKETPAIAEEDAQQAPAEAEGETQEASQGPSRMEKRRDRRRRRHRRSADNHEWHERRPQQEKQEPQQESEPKAQGGGNEDETKVSSPIFSSLIPPPTTLISQTLSRYKDKEFAEGAPQKEVEPKHEKEEKKKSQSDDGESSPMHRITPMSAATEENFSSAPFSNTDPFGY